MDRRYKDHHIESCSPKVSADTRSFANDRVVLPNIRSQNVHLKCQECKEKDEFFYNSPTPTTPPHHGLDSRGSERPSSHPATPASRAQHDPERTSCSPARAYLDEQLPDHRTQSNLMTELQRVEKETLYKLIYPARQLLNDGFRASNSITSGSPKISGPPASRVSVFPHHLRAVPNTDKRTVDREETDGRNEGKPICSEIPSAEKEMRLKYEVLKNEYFRVRQQEQILRNQMALLGAEIILTQTKTYHKSPADIRKITIDPISIRSLSRKRGNAKCETNDNKLVIQPLTKENMNHPCGRYFQRKNNSLNHAIVDPEQTIRRRSANNAETQQPTLKPIRREMSSDSITSFTENDERCYYFDMPLPVVDPPFTSARGPEMVTKHRLPKLPDIQQQKFSRRLQ